jgi:signal transduction histidine kinase/DNA-binding response OmpR family regulator
MLGSGAPPRAASSLAGTAAGAVAGCPAPARADAADLGEVDVEDSFEWLRRETLGVLLIPLGLGAWLALVPHLARPDNVAAGWGPLVLALVVVYATHVVRGWGYRLASGVLIFGLTTVVGLRTLAGDDGSIVHFFYLPLVFLAGTLRRTPVALLVAAIASATILHKASAPPAWPVDATVQVLAMIWASTLTAWLATRNLYTTLHWAWESQQRATSNLAEARRHRGELAGALRQLEDAAYRLERLNYALNWARLEADEARRVKAQFAAHVSHELRTPINLIVGFADMMLNVPQAYGGARLPIAYQADLQSLHRSATHLQGMIDDILDLSQLDAKEMPLLREFVDVRTVVLDAVGVIRQLLERKRLRLEVVVDAAVGTAHLDALRIRQILLNLLSNAARHTASGGVTVTCWREADRVRISVADTGEGIDPREIPRLFDAFHRLSPPSSGLHEGWGLGLAICKQFIELHGGTIEAASDGVPGRGTTFTITLPAHAPAGDARPDPAGSIRVERWSPTAPPAGGVVVLESDPHTAALYRRHLGDYEVHVAADRPEALSIARSVGAQALLVNTGWSDGDPGWLVEWRAVAADEGLRIIGCPMPGGQLPAHVGLDGYLVKPVTREQLLEAVRRVRPGARTVAVIDDDPHMIRMLSRMLRSDRDGLRVVRAYDGDEGLELIRRVRPDLVLLDVMMPRLDGPALLRTIRSEEALADVAVVGLSAKDATEVWPVPAGRVLALVADRGLTPTQVLRSVRSLLETLPPAEVARTAPARSPAGVPGA